MKEGGGEEGERERERALGVEYATALDIEVDHDPQRRRFGRRESDFALQRLVEGRAAKTKHVRVVALRWHARGSEVRLGLPVGL